jgi:peptidoglycan/LPS O-acetylase OafA/YrhL
MNAELSVYLDLMRLLAAGMVLVFHMNAAPVSGHILWRIAGHGTEGVIFFFVLSGFVISYITFHREHSARTYLVARAARIYSVAVVAIPVTLTADAVGVHMMPSLYQGQPFFNSATGASDIVNSLLFVNEIWFRHVIIGSDEPFWSLGFEVWYYAIFGALLFLSGRLRFTVAVLLMALSGPKILLYFSIWLLGVATFHLFARRRPNGRPLVPAIAGACLFVLTPALYLFVHAHRPGIGSFFGHSFNLDLNSGLTWAYYFIVALLFAAHLIGFMAISSVFTGLFNRCGAIVRWAAGASFTLYLIHQPVMLCLAAISRWPVGTLAHLLFVGTGTLAVVLAAAELGERRKAVWQRAIAAMVGSLAGPATRGSAPNVSRVGL